MRVLALAFLFLIPLCSAFDLSPASPVPGDKITISGKASPRELIHFKSSLSLELPVAGGQYEFATRVQIPRKPNRFTVSVRDVKDLNAGVKLGIWLTKRFETSGGTASLSHADVPEGDYDLKMFGEALPGVSHVPVDVVAETTVEADANGIYSIAIDTSGVPSGVYRIEGAGDSKTIRLGGSSASSDSSKSMKGSSAESVHAADESTSPKPPRNVDIAPEVVKWYADHIGLECKNESQYAETEGLLRKRLSGGYWLIIAKGEPLTEEAGNCEQKYCLVRGVDACKECREKDMILKGVQLAKPNDERGTSEASRNAGETASPKAPEYGSGLIGEIIGFIGRIFAALGIHPGG